MALAAAVLLVGCSSGGNKNNNQAATRAATAGQPLAATRAASPSPAPRLPSIASPATVATTAAAKSPMAGTPAAAARPATPASANAVQAQIVEPKDSKGVSDPMTWRFMPSPIKVPVGASITWTNTGISTHTVTADDGSSFDSGSINRGDTWSFTFSRPGTFAYHCTFHNWMKGTVIVGG